MDGRGVSVRLKCCHLVDNKGFHSEKEETKHMTREYFMLLED